jgi:hypothetical protein
MFDQISAGYTYEPNMLQLGAQKYEGPPDTEGEKIETDLIFFCKIRKIAASRQVGMMEQHTQEHVRQSKTK